MVMENQLILLLSDDDDDEPILYSQTQSGLTSEQRSRSARQKRLAMERRQARELRNVVDPVSYNGGGPCQPSIIHHGEMESQRWRGVGSSLGTRLGLEELSTNHHHARIGHSTTTKTAAAAAALDNGSSCQPGFAGTENCSVELVRDCGQQAAKRGRVEDQVGEWRSVRKTPARGSSFGRNISIPCFQPATPSSSPHEEEEQGEAVLNPETWKKMRFDAGRPKLEESLEFVETKKFTPSEQQMEVLHAIARGKSVFVTGSAGTGKSFILADALQCLREKFGNDAVFITASTGLAACSLGGTTLNTFAGVGFGKGSKEALLKQVKSRPPIVARWRRAKALIIDEISMVDGDFFDKLEYVARMVRGGTKPWGELQLIITGDFFQLPPVNPSNSQKVYAFQADCWYKSFEIQMELTHVFRQSDVGFVSMLNEIRQGKCSTPTLQRLQSCHGPTNIGFTGVAMTRLYPHKTDVSYENDQKLRALGSNLVVFRAKDDAKDLIAQNQLKGGSAPAVVTLCVGAQVMLIKNLATESGLVNGARGVVVGFSAPDDPSSAAYLELAKSINPGGQWPIVRFACNMRLRTVGPESWSILSGDREIARRAQVPLVLAWALSVHKCQGMTLDYVETDLSKAFGCGMVYVALSRVKSLEGLHLLGFDPSRIKTDPLVVKFYQELAVRQAQQFECEYYEGDYKEENNNGERGDP